MERAMKAKTLRIAAGMMAAVFVMGFVEPGSAGGYGGGETLETESAVPLEQGAMDVEFGMVYSRANSGKRGWWNNHWSRTRREGGAFRMYEWILEVTRGIAPDTDLTLSTGWVDMKDRLMPLVSADFGYEVGNHGRGMDDLRVSLKRRILDDRGVSVAYVPGLTIPIGRHTILERGRFGPGQNYWSFDQRLVLTHEREKITFNTDFGYSLPFGRTRRTYKRDFGVYTGWNKHEDTEKSPGERGVLDFNTGAVYTNGPFRPLAELNYEHRFVCSEGNDSDQLHVTVGGIFDINKQARLKTGYQHPVAGRNASRTRRLLLSVAYEF